MRNRDSGRMRRSIYKELDRKTILCLALIMGVVSIPLMTDYVLTGASLQASLSRIEAVRQGIGRAFPVRIGPWTSMDYGYGAASFQADVFYWVPALLRILGCGLGTAYKLSLFLANAGTAVIAYECFRKCFGRKDIGLIGSMLYTWCPCRLSEMYINGNLGEAAAWMFLPVLLSGLVRLYNEESTPGYREEDCDRLWVTFTWGFSLLAVSSTSMLFVAVGMSVIVFLFMGKSSLQKRKLLIVGRTICATLLINVWFLLPMLLRMRDASTVGILIPGDFQSRGMYFAQYLNVFQWGGDSIALFENGMTGAQAMGPGIAVILLVLLYIWFLYVRKDQTAGGRWKFGKRMICVTLLLIFLSSNCFPWYFFQDRNMLFSTLLALLQTPVKWGVSACAGLIVIACLTLKRVTERENAGNVRFLLLMTVLVSFGTTQFLLGNILKTRAYVRLEEENYTLLSLQIIMQESIAWRLCELISAAALCGGLAMSIVRRRKGVKKV